MTVNPAAEHLVREFTRRGLTIATAESLTAGLCAATIAEVPGASAVLRGGVIVYATELKHDLAGVSEETLRAHGPVAAETAAELAKGAARRCGADVGVALTGVAGPDPQDGHPVGEVFIGIYDYARGARVENLYAEFVRRQSEGEFAGLDKEQLRAEIRQFSLTRALEMASA
ncbi:CinA family protein [Corynebacterium jeikeium]|uniref:CinA family protein n=1 Tax=Corynebacterium jeikeium TaxID=38289 RepID=UPI0001B71BA7|nr:nicotinamide-nucleotide amidohydrolase family protein [Corynebacterium jeikeium]EEW16259.1 Tat pathway signal sequence domain protein [Corynebacterium jeikeium ATCC 43734]OOD34345.1 damage-inducible protein [Corynebacterium jeikeium]WCZ53676.1 Putative competence-damage inducible protein [Corynebacterium jeikeium]SUY81013.1 competence-damage inducible protein [Corynebacterium jeikeium]